MRFLDLFSGIGGFHLGLKPLGFECIGYSEIDKYAIEMYKNHFGEGNNLGDITKINASDLPDFDILTAGFPCQAFSIAGKRKGFEDTRGTLFFEIARILSVKKPTWFILENVKGLFSHDQNKTFKVIMSTLWELGYAVDYKVLNAKNFGIPQNRERIFIIGKLGENFMWSFDWRFDEYQPKVLNDILEDEVDEKYFVNVGIIKDRITWKSKGKLHTRKISNKDGIKKAGFLDQSFRAGADVVEMDSLSPTLTRQPTLIKVGNISPNDNPNFSATYDVHSPDGIAPTLVSGQQTSKLIKAGKRVRKLTPRECFRVMSFKDDYEIIVSDRQAYEVIGNSLCPEIVNQIGRKIQY